MLTHADVTWLRRNGSNAQEGGHLGGTCSLRLIFPDPCQTLSCGALLRRGAALSATAGCMGAVGEAGVITKDECLTQSHLTAYICKADQASS